MSYIKEVEVLDDEDQYNKELNGVERWWQNFSTFYNYWRNDLVRQDTKKILKDSDQMYKCAKWMAHHAREAMKYKAVM